jgi:hypothetical protein
MGGGGDKGVTYRLHKLLLQNENLLLQEVILAFQVADNVVFGSAANL